MKMKKWYNKLKGLLTATNLCALAMAVYTVNVTCAWAMHQPKVPDAMQKLKKF